MQISKMAWSNYIKALSNLDKSATKRMLDYIESINWRFGDDTRPLIDFAYSVSNRYGESAAALACEMYDAIAAASGANVPLAEPAAGPTYAEAAVAVNGTVKTLNENIVSSAVGRMVKMQGVDTIMYNAIRDGAEWAWIPQGDTCAFCITLASRGWQEASAKALKGGHAEHIHTNCDCMYAVRFDNSTNVQGYDPDKYLSLYQDTEGRNSKDKINAMRREFYQENATKINAQKRTAYQKRKERESSRAEELDV